MKHSRGGTTSNAGQNFSDSVTRDSITPMRLRPLFAEAFTVVIDSRGRFARALAIPFACLMLLDASDLVEIPTFFDQPSTS